MSVHKVQCPTVTHLLIITYSYILCPFSPKTSKALPLVSRKHCAKLLKWYITNRRYTLTLEEDEVPGTFNEQSKPSSTLQKSNNIVRTIVWFVHELLCHPRSGQLLLPEQLAGVGLLQVDTNSFLAQQKPLMTITLPQTSIWIASDVAEGSTEYVSYLTTAAVDVILMGRPAHAPGKCQI